MQIGTTSLNEGWHNQVKSTMGLGKHHNSTYSLAGVILTFEDCARTVDNRYTVARREWDTKELSLCTQFSWLKQFPFPAEIILSDNFYKAEIRQLEESQPIKPFDQHGECDCKAFCKWALPCEHMLEQFMWLGQDIEPN
jgi:hypothetical protein